MERAISALGILVFLGISYAFSINRRAVRWQTVAWGQVGGALLGKKTILNEFIAYLDLKTLIDNGKISQRAVIIATYALCNFANIGSIGITIGGITGMAPQRQHDLARMGVRSMIGGLLAGFITACIAGILV